MKPPIRGLFLADVDGTLLTPQKDLTRRSIEAIGKLKQEGIGFTIVSGRPPRGMGFLIRELEIELPYAAFNGGAIIHPDLSSIRERTLARGTIERAVQITEHHRLDYWIYGKNEWYVRDPRAPHVNKESETVHFEPKVVQDFSGLLEHVNKLVVVSDEPEKIKACQSDLAKELNGSASASFSQNYYVDVTPKDANKGVVVDDLCEILGISSSQIVTIGDMPNDILMFKKSGLSVAMGNSSEQVKKAASRTTDSNEHEGFARAAESLPLSFTQYIR